MFIGCSIIKPNTVNSPICIFQNIAVTLFSFPDLHLDGNETVSDNQPRELFHLTENTVRSMRAHRDTAAALDDTTTTLSLTTASRVNTQASFTVVIQQLQVNTGV